MIRFTEQSWITLLIWAALALSSLVSLALGFWSMAFVSFATLCLSFAPLVLAQRFHISLPLPFLAATTIFIFASIFMGEAFDFYERVWWWDLALHGASAIGFGLIGFLFIFMLFEGDRFAAPPSALAFLTFCTAVTMGTLWEVFEYCMDLGFGLSMQKSGLDDTMSDLMIDGLGAAIAAGVGYLYLLGQSKRFPGALLHTFIEKNKSFYRKSRDRLRK